MLVRDDEEACQAILGALEAMPSGPQDNAVIRGETRGQGCLAQPRIASRSTSLGAFNGAVARLPGLDADAALRPHAGGLRLKAQTSVACAGV